jgi:hypothetical protein
VRRDVHRRKGKVLVLTGTATLFSVRTLRHVAWARAEGLLPGGGPVVYDAKVITEDNELTLALLHLGYKVISPKACPPDDRGHGVVGRPLPAAAAVEAGCHQNLREYGLTRVTVTYWLRQVVMFMGVLVTTAYLASFTWSLFFDRSVHLHPIWLAVTCLFVAERMITVRSRGLLQMAVARSCASCRAGRRDASVDGRRRAMAARPASRRRNGACGRPCGQVAPPAGCTSSGHWRSGISMLLASIEMWPPPCISMFSFS